MKNLTSMKFSIPVVLSMTDEELKKIIYQANFNSKKVQYLKKSAEIIDKEHGGIVPGDFKKLIRLPGVGPKIANLLLLIGYDSSVGISVDTHIHRISNRLHWVSTKTPIQTMNEMEKIVDKEL